MTSRSPIPRIGRQLTPAERGLHAALERPDLLESLAKNLYLSCTGGRWAELPEAERVLWRDMAVEQQLELINNEPPPEPTGPDGGGDGIPAPIELVA